MKKSKTELTNEEKDEQVRETLMKLVDIAKVNNVNFLGLDMQIISTIIMAYQQGLKDCVLKFKMRF